MLAGVRWPGSQDGRVEDFVTSNGAAWSSKTPGFHPGDVVLCSFDLSKACDMANYGSVDETKHSIFYDHVNT